MSQPYRPISARCPHFLHGGDYNPDQWLGYPDVLRDDIRLMKQSHCNAMSVGIFAWAALEPEEGRYAFDWLDRTLDRLYRNRIYTVLATPSAAQPAWMSAKYPEILRVDENGTRLFHGVRVRYCLTSPVYREKCRGINEALAKRYGSHPGLILWHISNEYGGACHCDLCQDAFRDWLRRKYGSLDRLNHAWWTAFWSHTHTDWSQIRSPSPRGERCTHGLALDWRRFTTDQTVDFLRNEIEPLRRLTPRVPITTNMMGLYTGLNYEKFLPHLDVASWDCYPKYHDRPQDDRDFVIQTSFTHDLYRCFKNRPFLLMESTPSSVNWSPIMKLKRPGVHLLGSLQAVAHGSDSVQYFQWRAGRGCSEKFHGAVVAHDGTARTRVFQDVARVGRVLRKLDPVLGASVDAQVAILFDWENHWAINEVAGPRAEKRDYIGTCCAHYRPFWQMGIPVDVVNMDADVSKYRLVVAPMLYMLRPGVARRLETFVRKGGTFVTTYWSGIADENDLCFLGGRPGPLRDLLGIRSEELDVLYDDETVPVRLEADNPLGLQGDPKARIFCDLIHADTARVVARYAGEFYAGRPALTCNRRGKGSAYYMAFRGDEHFLAEFYGRLAGCLALRTNLSPDLPVGVTVQRRRGRGADFLFALNFTREQQTVDLGRAAGTDLISGKRRQGSLALEPYGCAVLRVRQRR